MICCSVDINEINQILQHHLQDVPALHQDVVPTFRRTYKLLTRSKTPHLFNHTKALLYLLKIWQDGCFSHFGTELSETAQTTKYFD